jgi:hypothetical protein
VLAVAGVAARAAVRRADAVLAVAGVAARAVLAVGHAHVSTRAVLCVSSRTCTPWERRNDRCEHPGIPGI